MSGSSPPPAPSILPRPLLRGIPAAQWPEAIERWADDLARVVETEFGSLLARYLPTGQGSMQGPLLLFQDPQEPTEPVTLRYLDAVVGAAGLPPGETVADALLARVLKAGDTMTGALYLDGDPVDPLVAAPRQFVVAKAGDTMTGALYLDGDPGADLVAAPKQYVDAGDRWVTIADAAITAVASIDVEWTEGDYRAVHIYLTGVLPASSVTTSNLSVRMKVGGSYLTGAGDYWRSLHYVDAGAAGVSSTSGTIGIFQATGNNVLNDEISVVAVLDPGGTGLEPAVLFNSKYSAPAGRGQAYGNVSCGTEGAVSGLRFLWNTSVNFVAQGHITVLGLKA